MNNPKTKGIVVSAIYKSDTLSMWLNRAYNVLGGILSPVAVYNIKKEVDRQDTINGKIDVLEHYMTLIIM